MGNNMNFEKNERGGWIISAGTEIAADIPEYSNIGNCCKIGDYLKIGYGCTFGDGCEIGDGCTFGNGCRFGDNCKIGNDCRFGIVCTFGNHCKFGYGCEIGDCFKFGDGCKIASISIIKMITLSNLDGSGRQIKLIFDEKKIHVEAGCFFGSVNEFCAKAEGEDKHFYSKIIRANASAMLEHYKC
jgi:acetyltransferase-like isoleucine patch superfamily enzyme